MQADNDDFLALAVGFFQKNNNLNILSSTYSFVHSGYDTVLHVMHIL